MENNDPTKLVIDLSELLNNFDPDEWTREDARLGDLLGFQSSITTIEGNGEGMTGVTKWKEKRNNKEHTLKTHIEVEVYGKMNFKDYHYIISLDGRRLNGRILKDVNLSTMKDTHKSLVTLYFNRMKYSLRDNQDTEFSDVG